MARWDNGGVSVEKDCTWFIKIYFINEAQTDVNGVIAANLTTFSVLIVSMRLTHSHICSFQEKTLSDEVFFSLEL